MLHLIFQSPLDAAILERIDPGDDVVFLENAVLRLLQKGCSNEALTRLLKQNRLCALGEDIAARGIKAEELIAGIDVIDYTGLVDLTVKNPVIQSWS
jgi:tRNA 2-thiouridine synthesizing protein B